jgi:hypothetical protein
MRHSNSPTAVSALGIFLLCAASACGDNDTEPNPPAGDEAPPSDGGGGGTDGPPGDGGGGGTDAAPPSAGGGSAGSTTFVRKFGGAGNEVAEARGLAAAADGSIVALSAIGNTGHIADPDRAASALQLELGIVRIDASGRTLWARSFPTNGSFVAVEGVVVTPQVGNVFVALGSEHLEGGPDLGGGHTAGDVLVKLGPTGDFVWQRHVDGFVTGTSVDGSGSALVGWVPTITRGLGGDRPVVSKYLWNGDLAWEVSPAWPVGPGSTEVAFDAFGDAVATFALSILKYTADGIPLWDVTLDAPAGSIEHVGTTASGTTVVGGWYSDRLSFAGTAIRPEGSDRGFFLAAIERDGRPRWLRSRSRPGPFAVDPEGRLAVVEKDFSKGCDVVAKWDLTGKVLWRRTLARCDADGSAPAPAVNVAVGPDHGIWVQGDAAFPFDVGTGVLTPSGWDWFVARLAP